ncbi:hypothetical protein [Nocardia sputorum]|uniref:hypothetical protein n=1 Tax=Nocardia sputorum TaxID=2984338 RepID=UPI003D9CA403
MRDQQAGHVVPGRLPPVGDEFTEDPVHLHIVRLRLLRPERRVEDAVDAGAQTGVQVFRNAHQRADDLNRQRVGEAFPEVHRFPRRRRREFGQEVRGDLLDHRAHRLGAAVGERGRDEFAQSAMVRAVRGEHVVHRDPRQQRPVLRDLPVDERRPVLLTIFRHPGVRQQPLQHVGVGDRPRPHAARQFDQGHRPARANSRGLALDVGARGVED